MRVIPGQPEESPERTHISRTITVNGVEKIVWTRTPETEIALEQRRLGFVSKVSPLEQEHLLIEDGKMPKYLVIVASYDTALRAIRARLEVDKSAHRILTGTKLLGDYFGTQTFREGFPTFKQFFLLFGYFESKNKLLHELIPEAFMARTQSEGHCWLFLPDTLENVSNRWGGSLTRLNRFPQLVLTEPDGSVPVLRSDSTESLPVLEESPVDMEPDNFDDPKPLTDDPVNERRRKRDREKHWRR